MLIMYMIACLCPKAVLSFLTKFIVRTGQLFLTIWPPTEPASRLVR